MTATGFWNFLASIFQAIFKVVAGIGWGLNLLLILLGFVAFIAWVYYMTRQKEVTKWD